MDLMPPGYLPEKTRVLLNSILGGTTQQVYPHYTATQISDKAHAVNITGKRAYKSVWDTTNHRLMTTEGATDVSPWYSATGAVTVTPA